MQHSSRHLASDRKGSTKPQQCSGECSEVNSDTTKRYCTAPDSSLEDSSCNQAQLWPTAWPVQEKTRKSSVLLGPKRPSDHMLQFGLCPSQDPGSCGGGGVWKVDDCLLQTKIKKIKHHPQQLRLHQFGCCHSGDPPPLPAPPSGSLRL